jgi:Xaa-Pro aminopeptidase
MTNQEKLRTLRSAMQQRNLAAYIIPSSDPHQSEYMAAHWKSRQWISGFSGSAGIAVITADHAGLWTDSRYFIQAEEQLKGSGVELHKLGVPHTPEHLDWMKANLPAGCKIGLDGRLFSVGQVRQLAKHFYDKKIELDTSVDLIGEAWKDRPALPQSPVFEHELKYAGVSRETKLEQVREKMGEADFYLISTLDDIAWLFNLRGHDVDCNPVFYAYAIVGKEAAWLFIEMAKVPTDLKEKLNGDCIIVKAYDQAEAFLKNIAEGKTILLDKGTTSNQFYNAISQEKIKEGENVAAALKAIKNPVESGHLKNAMVRDGVALLRLFRWLDKTLDERPVPEAEVADRLAVFRKEQEKYYGESFDAIVGYNANGAIVHYKPEHGSCASIEKHGILLLDSGGQYLDGTTDITRTVALSEPTEEQKIDFTLVLKGHIALDSAKFPKGTTGVQLDTLARMALWQHHLNYGHGTGHGVGFFLSVHEGPHGISPVSSARSSVSIEPGTVTSNEPGLYRAGKHGIRTENLILCVEDAENDFGKFYKFETLTLFPIDLSLVEKSLLSQEECEWINRYHSTVFEKISPFLNAEETAWLKEKCGKV